MGICTGLLVDGTGAGYVDSIGARVEFECDYVAIFLFCLVV